MSLYFVTRSHCYKLRALLESAVSLFLYPECWDYKGMPHTQPGYILLFLSHDYLVREKLLRSFSHFTIEEIEVERSDIYTNSAEFQELQSLFLEPQTVSSSQLASRLRKQRVRLFPGHLNKNSGNQQSLKKWPLNSQESFRPLLSSVFSVRGWFLEKGPFHRDKP